MSGKRPALAVCHFLVCVLIAACAAPPKTPGDFRIQTGPPTQDVRFTGAKAWVEPYGLLVRGTVGIRTNVTAVGIHSVDVDVAGANGKEINKFTTRYNPVPRLNRSKPQVAHFMVVISEVPPAGSVIKITFTPEPPKDPVMLYR